MIDGMEIQQFYFTGQEQPDYVLIKLDVGKMPPHRAKEYLERVRDNLSICKVLDEADIRYDLVGVPRNENKINATEYKITTDLTELNKKAQKDIAELEEAVTRQKGTKIPSMEEALNRSFKGATLKSAHETLKAPNFDDAMSIVKR